MPWLSFLPCLPHPTFVHMNYELYRKYLEHQAANHPDLLHSSTEGERIFAMMNIEEALGDLRQQAAEKSYIMRGFHYTYALQDNGQGRKQPQGGFLVAKHYSLTEGGSAAFFSALQDSERIIDEIVEKLISDSRAGHPLFLHSLDAEQDIQVRPRPYVSDGYAGWYCTFSFYNHYRVCIEDDAAPEWVDGGQTPFDL